MYNKPKANLPHRDKLVFYIENNYLCKNYTMNKITSLLNSLSSIVTDQKQVKEETDKLSALQYIKRFALNTYYGIRQWLLQVIIFDIPIEIATWLGCYLSFGRFGIEGYYMVVGMFLYTMLFYWFKTFASHLRPLLQIIIPYIPYALMVYLKIVSRNDWNFKRVTIDYYMLEGWLMPLYSLMIIGLERAVKKRLPNNKVTRVIKIIWNVLTILLATLIAIATVGFTLC